MRFSNIVWFISSVKEIKDTVRYLQKEVIHELQETYLSTTREEKTFGCFE